MTTSIFTWAYLVGLSAGSVIRAIYSRRLERDRGTDRRERERDMLLLLPFMGMIVIPLVYVLTSWLTFANYRLPAWAGWAGVVLFSSGLWLLWRSHADLGRNWTPTLKVRDGHLLVTEGVFRYIRHPMYAAHLLWAIGQPLLLQNWIAGWAMLATFIPVYLVRVRREERMMLEHFGESYRLYMKRTGRVIPGLRR